MRIKTFTGKCSSILYEELLIAFYCDTITSDRADLTFEMVSFVTQLSSKVEGLGEIHSFSETYVN